MERCSYKPENSKDCWSPPEARKQQGRILQQRHWRELSLVLLASRTKRINLCFCFLVFFKKKFIYLFLAALGLRCCTQAFSSCGEQGLLFVAARGLHHRGGFSCCGAWALGARVSVVVARGLSSCGTRV